MGFWKDIGTSLRRNWFTKYLKSDLFRKEIFGTAAKAVALDEAPAKFIVINRKFQVVFWNNRDEIYFGYKEDEVLGKIPDFLFPNGHRLAFTGLLNQWNEQNSINERDVEMDVITKEGKRFPTEIIFVSRRIIEEFYLIVVIKDISRRKKIELQYQKEIELYKFGERVGNFGSWYWDIIENKVTISAGFKKIFNVETDEEGAEYFMKRVHPEDRGSVGEIIRKGFESASDYVIPSYRIIQDNVEWKAITCIAEARKNENGKLIAFLGFIKFID